MPQRIRNHAYCETTEYEIEVPLNSMVNVVPAELTRLSQTTG
jgi:hypothetical protein